MNDAEPAIMKHLCFCLFIVLVVGFSFSPCLKNQFTNWDDDALLVDNPRARSLSIDNFAKIFSGVNAGTYIPLTILSFAVEYRFFDLKPFYYHLNNIVLHIINCLLVYVLIFAITRNPAIALMTAMLFGVHPLKVESVAWVAERKDVLFAMFYLASLICHVMFVRGRSILNYVLAFFFFLLSLFSKGAAVTLPLIMLLLDHVLSGRLTKRGIIEKVPFFVLSFVFSIIAVIAQQTLPGHTVPILRNVFVVNYVIVFYFQKIILPIGLSPLYPFPNDFLYRLPLIFILSPIFVSCLAFFYISAGRYVRIIRYGVLAYFIGIAPVLQIMPVAGPEIAANRYTYLPMVGLAMIVAFGIYRFAGRLKSVLRALFVMLVASTVFVLALVTFGRCSVWHDSITLWNEVLRNYPDSPHAYNMRGLAYLQKGELERAVEDFSRAIRIRPRSAIAYNNRGKAFRAQANYMTALKDYNTAIEINPRYAEALYNRGNLYLAIASYDLAIADYSAVLELRPYYVQAYNNRGTAYRRKGQYQKAIDDYSHALGIAPDLLVIIENRSVVYYLSGDIENARQDALFLLDRGHRLDPAFLESIGIR